MAEPDPARGPVALVSARALGDGLLTLVLAENLRRAGRRATLYHTQLTELAAWFPDAVISPLPDEAARLSLLREAPAAFVGDAALGGGDPGATLVFTKALWDRGRPYLRSLEKHAARAFGIAWSTDENGLVPPPGVRRAAHPRRVCIHPTSARPNKDWPAGQFIDLAALLSKEGFEPVFLLAEADAEAWTRTAGDEYPTAIPGTLDRVAAFLHESGGAVATDSGIGHLAANVGLPTLSIFRKRSASRFWAPAWGPSRVVTAPVRLPGAGGHRHWGRLLRPARVLHAFRKLVSEASP